MKSKSTSSPLGIYFPTINAKAMLTIHKAVLTLAQRTVDGKSNEIPAVQELLKGLNIKGHMVVADALNYQKEWSVETMHWLLDVHFEEDWCMVEDKTVQSNLNIFRKTAINRYCEYLSFPISK